MCDEDIFGFEDEDDMYDQARDFIREFTGHDAVPRWMVEKYYAHAERMALLDPCTMPDIERVGYWEDEK